MDIALLYDCALLQFHFYYGDFVKRKALLHITKALASPRKVTQHMTASIMGKVQSAEVIAPWGPYTTFSVADTLKNATCSFHICSAHSSMSSSHIHSATTNSRPRKHQGRCCELLSEWTTQIMGRRYKAMLHCLVNCRICLLPHILLSIIANLCSSRPIKGTLEIITTSLLTHELDFLPSGSNLSAIRSSLLPP
jgi:hypothetical protein